MRACVNLCASQRHQHEICIGSVRHGVKLRVQHNLDLSLCSLPACPPARPPAPPPACVRVCMHAYACVHAHVLAPVRLPRPVMRCTDPWPRTAPHPSQLRAPAPLSPCHSAHSTWPHATQPMPLGPCHSAHAARPMPLGPMPLGPMPLGPCRSAPCRHIFLSLGTASLARLRAGWPF